VSWRLFGFGWHPVCDIDISCFAIQWMNFSSLHICRDAESDELFKYYRGLNFQMAIGCPCGCNDCSTRMTCNTKRVESWGDWSCGPRCIFAVFYSYACNWSSYTCQVGDAINSGRGCINYAIECMIFGQREHRFASSHKFLIYEDGRETACRQNDRRHTRQTLDGKFGRGVMPGKVVSSNLCS